MKTETIYVDLDQIVFEGREQRYGAYSMRKNYDRFLSRAMLITFILFLSITGLPKVADWITPDEDMVSLTVYDGDLLRDITTPEIKQPDEPEVRQVKPALPPPPPVRTVQFLVIRPTPDDEVDPNQTIADVKTLDSAAVGLKDMDGGDGSGVSYNFDDLIGDDTGGPAEIDGEKDTFPTFGTFVAVDREPRPVNLDELRELIGYPRLAVEAEIEGKVTVSVLVSKTGDYVKHKVLKDPHPILTKAVNERIHLLKMTPGIQGVKPVPVWVTIPFEFDLKD